MKRKTIHQTRHPFDPFPFEAFWYDSWQKVERLRVSNGAITTVLVDGEDLIEESIPVSNVRLRSRKANLSDCVCFLRPGIDICVLSTPPIPEDSSEDSTDDEKPPEEKFVEEQPEEEPVWLDAKINSIERKPHEPACNCQFYVSFYVTQGPLGMMKKKLHKEITTVELDQISILQKLEWKPCENETYRWDLSDDCFSLQKYKLFTGKFSSDLSWLLVASVLKQVDFEVRSVNNRIVYQILDDDSENSLPNSVKEYKALTFKLENDVSVPVLVNFTQPDAAEDGSGHGMDENEESPNSDVMGLRRSKRRNVKPERYLGCENMPELDSDVIRIGTHKLCRWEYDEMPPLALSIQGDNGIYLEGDSEADPFYENNPSTNLLEWKGKKEGKKAKLDGSYQTDDEPSDDEQLQLAIVPVLEETDQALNRRLPIESARARNNRKINGRAPKFLYGNGTTKLLKRNLYGSEYSESETRWWWKNGSNKDFRKRGSDYPGYLTRPGKNRVRERAPHSKSAFSASVYKEMIRRCMENIKSTVNKEQPHVISQWKDFKASRFFSEKESHEISTVDKDEDSELEMLWKEMELCMSTYLLEDNEEMNIEDPGAAAPNGPPQCRHEYRLNEEIGVVCDLCGDVSIEIKDVSPSFMESMASAPVKRTRAGESSEDNPEVDPGFDMLSIPAASNIPLSDREDNAWALIPELKNKLRFHQKKAFEFLWRNIAGSIVPAKMEAAANKRGGCVISHTPGAGKTFLIIAFLTSYLKLFPGSRPLVLAPKTTLYTWYKETLKWEIPIPVYQIHGGQTYRGEVLRHKPRVAPGAPKPNQDVMHVIDCLEKIQKWLAHPSILLMGYTSFLMLTREDSKYGHRQYMGKVLRQCPGILILDEGHNPRSTKSRLRKGLMKVDTKLRILLSGTLFQNNFGEYFNTLTLARPTFVQEVLKELDPRYKKDQKGAKTKFSLENRARKYFIDKIGKRINSSSIAEERMEGLNMLKNLTSGFIDAYEGSSDHLPGLQCYTLMMKSTPYQQELLVKLQNQRPAYKGFPLELELLITLGAIHPWLIRTTACSSQYFTEEVLEDLDKYKFDLKFGSKVRFVMSLIPRCLIRKEKLLIFCHNIAPINLFIDIFQRFFGWRKGEEILVLQGDIELFERGRIMEKFEEPTGPSKIMLASITACAEGISLTAASRVILLDSEWNPSKSKQAIARAFRPGQAKEVYVYQLLATGTLEEEKYIRTTWKEWVSSMIFSEELVEDPSHWQAEKIEDDILREIVEEDRATLFHMIMKNEKASNSVVRDRAEAHV